MKLLVPLDGSPLSEAVLGPVAAAARRLRAQVLLVMVGELAEGQPTPRSRALPSIFPVGTLSGGTLAVPAPADIIPHAAEDRGQAIERAEAELTDYLLHCAKRLPGIAVQTRVILSDDPARAILDIAREQRADWIAMTTHGRSGVSRLLAGSVADAVIRAGVAPVLVVHPRHEETGQ